jgi:general secretion pathway protein G
MNMKTHRLANAARLARRRCGAAGVTLIEILIVLAIIGLIAGGIAVFAVPKFRQGQIDSTRSNAKILQPIADAWRTGHGNECPTVQILRDQKEIAATSNINDAWGKAYQIECTDDDTIIVSWGPDGKQGTADDIREPDIKPTN